MEVVLVVVVGEVMMEVEEMKGPRQGLIDLTV